MIVNAVALWKNRSLAGHVLLETCSICVDTELRGVHCKEQVT